MSEIVRQVHRKGVRGNTPIYIVRCQCGRQYQTAQFPAQIQGMRACFVCVQTAREEARKKRRAEKGPPHNWLNEERKATAAERRACMVGRCVDCQRERPIHTRRVAVRGGRCALHALRFERLQ